MTKTNPISAVIKDRIKQANKSAFANQNIAEFIQAGELDKLTTEVEEKVQALLDSLIIDTENDHNTKDTAKRVAKMYMQEVFHGRYEEEPPVVDFPNAANLNEIYTVGPIRVRSCCSHHMVPIVGEAWVGVLPSNKVIGLSKFSRIVHWYMSRPHIQEEAAVALADHLENLLQPKGLALVIKAKHMCMTWRGVQEHNTSMVNAVMRGAFLADKSKKREFYAIIQAQGYSSHA